jgi:ABC-type transporter Mla maintaining outer membrane lipid asymmetry ATPase subunit MlaF
MTSVDAPLVVLKDIHFGYGDRPVLEGVSLQVPRGKVTALMGASGGGKTTVLRLIGGQYTAQSGQLLFDGQNVSAAGAFAALDEAFFAHRTQDLLKVFQRDILPIRDILNEDRSLILMRREVQERT